MAPRNTAGAHAVAVLATSVVLAMGLILCGTIIVTSSDRPGQSLAIFIGCAVGLGVLLWWLGRPKPEGVKKESYWFAANDRKVSQKWKVRKMRTSTTPGEAPAPPSVESVRELSEGVNTWVPHGRYKADPERPGGKPGRT